MKRKRITIFLLLSFTLIVAAVWMLCRQQQEGTGRVVEENRPNAEQQIESVKEHMTEKVSEEAAAKVEKEASPSLTEISDEVNELLKDAEESGVAVEQKPAAETEADLTNSSKNGLHFVSREEAMQFVLSRFSKEEIALYHQVSDGGLTAEQQQMALQIAYSRFSAEEIAVIEEVLK